MIFVKMSDEDVVIVVKYVLNLNLTEKRLVHLKYDHEEFIQDKKNNNQLTNQRKCNRIVFIKNISQTILNQFF